MHSTADFQKIKLLIFDIDGTLTDGSYSCSADGKSIKFFNIHDQHWLKLAIRAGLKTALLSARNDEINRIFASDAMISKCMFGAKNKLDSFNELCAEMEVSPEECLYAGDDVVDLPPMKRAGIAVTPADAVAVMDEASPWRTAAAGGKGVACEIVYRVLSEQGTLDQVLERYRQ